MTPQRSISNGPPTSCATNTAIAKAALEQCRKSAAHNAPYYDGPIGAIGTDTPLSTGIDDDGRQFPGASSRPRPRGRACTSRSTLPAPHAASQQGSVGPGGVASCSTTDAASPPRLQSTSAGLCTSAASCNTRAVAARPRTLSGSKLVPDRPRFRPELTNTRSRSARTKFVEGPPLGPFRSLG